MSAISLSLPQQPSIDDAAKALMERHDCKGELDTLLQVSVKMDPAHDSSGSVADQNLLDSLRCLRLWLLPYVASSEAEGGHPPLGWTAHAVDSMLLLSVQQACQRLALTWVRSLAYFSSALLAFSGASAMMAAACEEVRLAERCAAAAHRAALHQAQE